NVSHVVSFDVPDTPDAYTHRIGRTGRAERSGKAFTLVCETDHAAVRDIERRLGAPIPRRQLPGIASAAGIAAAKNCGARENLQRPSATPQAASRRRRRFAPRRATR